VLLAAVESVLPEFAAMLANFRPAALRGRTLCAALPLDEVRPHRLREVYARCRVRPEAMADLAPMVAFATAGQAKFDGAISAEEESRAVIRLLRYWALKGSVDSSIACSTAVRPARRRGAAAVALAV
jgi:hypothetical protein